jgi:NAD(P)-dependent dehydrogenase (short-subunit alcohol dehydrogenase family)
MVMQEFDGKVAVVTGAASGMGRAFAERFAQEGMKVVLADIEEEALEKAVLELRRKEFEVLGVVTDVSKPEAVENLARRAIDAYGKVHLLFNNAGVSGELCFIWEATPRDWQWTMGVNLWGVVHGMRTFVPLMLAHGEVGHIVNTASIAGLISGWGIYGVTKQAVVAMSESLAAQLQLIDARIGVSVLCPSAVNTNIPTSRRNRPPDLINDADDPANVITPQMQRYRERMNAALAFGKDPAEIADIVYNAIRNGDFYILTHPDQQEERVRARAETIISRRAPRPPAFITDET